jgi:hypothetical protein
MEDKRLIDILMDHFKPIQKIAEKFGKTPLEFWKKVLEEVNQSPGNFADLINSHKVHLSPDGVDEALDLIQELREKIREQIKINS